MTSVANSAATTTQAATASASASATKSETAKTSLGKDFNTFLNMLTTQLKHQDPLSPMDSTQFTSQLVQYSGVEQQINVNSNLEKMIKLQEAGQTSQAISYLGQTVEMDGTTIPLQSSSANFSYSLPKAAKEVEVQIKDSTGSVVYKTSADTASGRHDLSWDGKDSSGKVLDDGIYTLNVVAKAADNSAIAATTTTIGQVTKVTNDATNGTSLEVGAGTKDAKITTTPDKVLSITANNTTTNAQLAAANAQYQAALAQINALQSAAQ
ncbi:MAG: flagellar hook capping FlgD N-terminal domain-containing protein [Phaeospirillum sp.]|nr:flagellar hook capping FlgD N-terminal domain-containing protein [Phaeospirillum sp.]